MSAGLSISAGFATTSRGSEMAIAISEPRLVVAKPALILRPALIARSAEPRLELVLHSPLNDQPGTELRQLRKRLSGVLAHPNGKQLVDLVLDLRRRRYGTSHGVGLLLRLCRTRGNLRRHLDGSRSYLQHS